MIFLTNGRAVAESHEADMRFNGVRQIVQFNWPFYALALFAVLAALAIRPFLPINWQFWLWLTVGMGALTTLLSVIASWYVYDAKDLYAFDYIDSGTDHPNEQIANIHAGFDQTTTPLRIRFPQAKVDIFDFYDPKKHTEASIRRARKHYPASEDTRAIASAKLPVADGSYDRIFIVFAAHEIRDEAERIAFFCELRRVAKPNTSLYVIEHLRDWRNALVYSIGCLHFYSDTTWRRTYQQSGWQVSYSSRQATFIISYHLTCSST